MALIKCEECGKQISDKAVACPHCGFPIKIKTNEGMTIEEQLKESQEHLKKVKEEEAERISKLSPEEHELYLLQKKEEESLSQIKGWLTIIFILVIVTFIVRSCSSSDSNTKIENQIEEAAPEEAVGEYPAGEALVEGTWENDPNLKWVSGEEIQKASSQSNLEQSESASSKQITSQTASNSQCQYAKSMAEQYVTQANNYNLSSQASACSMADALEQAVNWMGTMQQQCPNFESEYGYLMSTNQSMLMMATQKCGH